MTTDDATPLPGLGPWREGTRPDFEPFPDDAVGRSLADRLALVADRFADHPAIASPAGRWSYAELMGQVRRRAAGLMARLGTEAAVPVAVMAQHDGPLVVTILSVISAGHMVVVLDPFAPAAVTAHQLAESGTPLVLHDAAHAEAVAAVLAESAATVEAVDVESVDADPVPFPVRGPQSPAMLAFTSGTSGSPKGAVITHGLLLNLVRGATNALGIGPDDRMPMLFPTSLAVAAYPMFLPLLNGGALATLDVRSVGLAPIGEFLESEQISLAYLAPTVVRFLVDALGGRSFPDLRMVALGGEGVDAEAVALTAELLTPQLIGIGYGTTETGVVSLGVLDATHPAPDGAVSAGYAVPEVELFILDDRGDLLVEGEAGEIAVSSPYVFAGYLGHPELDRQLLTDDPGGRAGWRMYRTGDHGRLDEHGALVILGRLDTKVKVRGRFVVLGDVEASLHAAEEVADAAVVATDRGGNTELVAYVVPSGDALDTTALRARLLETQETYRVPSSFVVLDEMPQLPNGKTDRRALPSADSVLGVDAPGTAPRPGGAPPAAEDRETIRQALRSLWEDLLPVATVGIDEDFALLGGDSLLAAQMLVLVEQRLGVIVPMGELVHARTVRELAEVVHRIGVETSLPSTVARVQGGDEASRPRLWFVHDLQGSAYRVRHVARALGPDQPVWSFESPLLRGEPNRFGSLDTFVANYLTDLRRAQPEGPYWLAGYSFGGICAYEMARQLSAAGEEIAFVGVVDVGPGYRGPGWHGNRSPFRPWFGIAKPPPAGASLREQATHYVEMLRSGPSRAARHLMVRSGISRVVDPLRFRNDLRTHGRVRPSWRLWYAWEEHWKLAATAWDRANTYPGAVDLFWAEDTPSADASMGWSPLVGDLRIHRFPGDHEGILEERGAAALGGELRRALDERVE